MWYVFTGITILIFRKVDSLLLMQMNRPCNIRTLISEIKLPDGSSQVWHVNN